MADIFLPTKPPIIFVSEEISSLAGNVTFAGSPVEREVLVYKNNDESLYGKSVSNASGDWDIPVNGNSNDRFRIIVIGESGEFSKAFENVRLP